VLRIEVRARRCQASIRSSRGNIRCRPASVTPRRMKGATVPENPCLARARTRRRPRGNQPAQTFASVCCPTVRPPRPALLRQRFAGRRELRAIDDLARRRAPSEITSTGGRVPRNDAIPEPREQGHGTLPTPPLAPMTRTLAVRGGHAELLEPHTPSMAYIPRSRDRHRLLRRKRGGQGTSHSAFTRPILREAAPNVFAYTPAMSTTVSPTLCAGSKSPRPCRRGRCPNHRNLRTTGPLPVIGVRPSTSASSTRRAPSRVALGHACVIDVVSVAR